MERQRDATRGIHYPECKMQGSTNAGGGGGGVENR